jgi:hypothetical protein
MTTTEVPRGVQRAFVVDDDVEVKFGARGRDREDGRPVLSIKCGDDEVLVHEDAIDQLVYALRELVGPGGG